MPSIASPVPGWRVGTDTFVSSSPSRDRGREDTEQEILGGDRALARGTADRHRRSERDEERREVVGGVVDAQVARRPCRGCGPARRRSSTPTSAGSGRATSTSDELGELRARHHRPDLEHRLVGGEGDHPQLVEIGQIDEHVGRGGPRFHHVDERLPARERTCPIVLGEQGDRLLDGGRTRVFDLS